MSANVCSSVAPRPTPTRLALLGLAVLAAFTLLAAGGALAAKDSGCVTCHSKTSYRVTHPKLYEYYQNWQVSAHKVAGVTCVDCHGGDPGATGKEAAHKSAALTAAAPGSPLNYRNIPKTCAQCHDDIYQHYKQSEHYQALEDTGDAQVAPNCVTCHGSVNLSVLSVNNVRPFCATCHDEESGNHPWVPEEAQEVLNNFLSIQRYYRGIAIRGNPEEVQAFFGKVDKRIKRLVGDWHSFDLDQIRQQTQELMLMVKEKRKEVMEQAQGKR